MAEFPKNRQFMPVIIFPGKVYNLFTLFVLFCPFLVLFCPFMSLKPCPAAHGIEKRTRTRKDIKGHVIPPLKVKVNCLKVKDNLEQGLP